MGAAVYAWNYTKQTLPVIRLFTMLSICRLTGIFISPVYMQAQPQPVNPWCSICGL